MALGRQRVHLKRKGWRVFSCSRVFGCPSILPKFISGPLVTQEAGTPAVRGPMESILPPADSPTAAREAWGSVLPYGFSFPRRANSARSPSRSDSASSPAPAAANMPAARWSPRPAVDSLRSMPNSPAAAWSSRDPVGRIAGIACRGHLDTHLSEF
jgi:hypothetical protein